jgi:hypothetical protein
MQVQKTQVISAGVENASTENTSKNRQGWITQLRQEN